MHTVTWTEGADAGQLLGAAQEPLGNGPLKNIYGPCQTGDVDLYRIYISSPATFSASGPVALIQRWPCLMEAAMGYTDDDARLGDSIAGLPALEALGVRKRRLVLFGGI